MVVARNQSSREAFTTYLDMNKLVGKSRSTRKKLAVKLRVPVPVFVQKNNYLIFLFATF